jgi:CheY-like chemotaxis protein
MKPFVFQSVEKVIKQQNIVPEVKNNAAQADPLVQDANVTDPLSDETVADGTQRKRIVILDDDPEFTAAINRLLKSAGYEPHAVNVPDEIFPLIDRVKPDLIILDLKMPGTSGSYIAAALSQNQKTSAIPVVILSGMISVYDQTTVKKTGGSQYFLAKSAEPDSWLATIAKILG